MSSGKSSLPYSESSEGDSIAAIDVDVNVAVGAFRERDDGCTARSTSSPRCRDHPFSSIFLGSLLPSSFFLLVL